MIWVNIVCIWFVLIVGVLLMWNAAKANVRRHAQEKALEQAMNRHPTRRHR